MIKKSKLFKRILQFLRSDDLEMVQLGGMLMQLHIPRWRWEKILFRELSTRKGEMNEYKGYITSWDHPKFQWKIEKKHITIERYEETSPWTNATWGTNITYVNSPIIYNTTLSSYSFQIVNYSTPTIYHTSPTIQTTNYYTFPTNCVTYTGTSITSLDTSNYGTYATTTASGHSP